VTTCTLINADCLEAMRDIPDGSVDMVLTDPPYGTTACKWDTVIPFEPMWEQLKRITKKNGAIVLTASQPFTSALIMSNVKMFKYEWIWEKSRPSGHVHAKNKPMKKHENVCVFSGGNTLHKGQSADRMNYFPQGLIETEPKIRNPINTHGASESGMAARKSHKPTFSTATNYPQTIQKFANPNGKTIHPTQKPVALMEYLIRTYTNEGETVLDFTMGSGTTGVACKNLDRSFIGIEMDAVHFANAAKRIDETPLPIGDLLDD
jgi:site-specific DNA-methyltransferase (adenine-specific)